MTRARYAIYFAPPQGSELDRFGSHWLGRDAWTGAPLQSPPVDGFSPSDFAALTASPSSYGLHATLKPPFYLRAGTTEQELRAQLAAFASKRHAFACSPLRLATLGRFVALILQEPCDAMSLLADDCVTSFDAFRAPPSTAETQRRKSAPLSHRQVELLERWGYPYVLEQWQFHISLTGSTDAATAERARRVLEPRTQAFTRKSLAVDAVCLFRQSAEDAPFLVMERFPFAGVSA
jgi:putative phosphonate metabolism protein